MPPLLAPLLFAPLLAAAPPAPPVQSVPPLPMSGAVARAAVVGTAVGDAIAGADAAAAAVLQNWQRRTAGRTPVSAADRAAAAHARPGAPAELLALAAALSGPVDAAALTTRYRWTAAGGAASGAGALRAVPADPLARVFTPTLTVSLAADGAPRAVTARPAGGPPRTLALAPAPRSHRAVLAAAMREGSPGRGGRNPVNPVRTALLTRTADAAPAWRLNRRVRRVPRDAPAPRAPLTAPKPE